MRSAPEPVVVGVDCSRSSRSTLRWAAAEARLRSLALVAVHVWRPTPAGAEPTVRMARNAWDALDATLGDSAEELRGIEVRRIVVRRDPGAVLLEEAAKGTMLVIGAGQPRSGPATATRADGWTWVQHATRPVVLVPDQVVTSRSQASRGVVDFADARCSAAVPQRYDSPFEEEEQAGDPRLADPHDRFGQWANV